MARRRNGSLLEPILIDDDSDTWNRKRAIIDLTQEDLDDSDDSSSGNHGAATSLQSSPHLSQNPRTMPLRPSSGSERVDRRDGETSALSPLPDRLKPGQTLANFNELKHLVPTVSTSTGNTTKFSGQGLPNHPTTKGSDTSPNRGTSSRTHLLGEHMSERTEAPATGRGSLLPPLSNRIPEALGSRTDSMTTGANSGFSGTSRSASSTLQPLRTASVAVEQPSITARQPTRISKSVNPPGVGRRHKVPPSLIARQSFQSVRPASSPGNAQGKPVEEKSANLNHAREAGTKENFTREPETTTNGNQKREVSRTTPLQASGVLDLVQKKADNSTVPRDAKDTEAQHQKHYLAQSRSSEPPVIKSASITWTRSFVDDCLRKHLQELSKSHSYRVWGVLRRQRTSLERERLGRRGNESVCAKAAKSSDKRTSPFEGMSAHVDSNGKKIGLAVRRLDQEIYTRKRQKDPSVRSSCYASTTKYRCSATHVPVFREYVSLQDNILAENNTKMLHWPYFLDDDRATQEGLYVNLPKAYKMQNDDQPHLNLRNDQCRFYDTKINDFLRDLNLTWEHILFWFLSKDDAIQNINNRLPESAAFRNSVVERNPHCKEDFNRSNEKWKDVFSDLQEPDPHQLRFSALASAAVLKQCGFSLWHLARRSNIVRDHTIKKLQPPEVNTKFTYRSIACAICQTHDCLFHGEVREVPEDDVYDEEDEESTSNYSENSAQTPDESETSDDENKIELNHETSDPDIEKVINYKCAINTSAHDAELTSTYFYNDPKKPPPGKFRADWWLTKTYTAHWEERKPFIPCSHEGSCDQAKCRCFREEINCEKTCACSKSCERRFPGCSCTYKSNKSLCGTSECLCNKLGRECDVDLCRTCGATDILDPINRYNENVLQCKCFNVALQRGVPKKTLLGHSEVHGFGLYAGEDIKKDEFIGEYKGDIATIEEGNRRWIIYDFDRSMYLFRLNLKQELDATYLGNKTRFINNANDRNSNCYPRNLLCNTACRLAIFAKHDIKAGTELFFNYNYPEEKVRHFKQPKTSKSEQLVAVKKTASATTSGNVTTAPATPGQVSQQLRCKNVKYIKRSTPERQKQTAKARAVKASLRSAQRQQEQIGHQSARPPRRARKSAVHEPIRSHASRPAAPEDDESSDYQPPHESDNEIQESEDEDNDNANEDDSDFNITNNSRPNSVIDSDANSTRSDTRGAATRSTTAYGRSGANATLGMAIKSAVVRRRGHAGPILPPGGRGGGSGSRAGSASGSASGSVRGGATSAGSLSRPDPDALPATKRKRRVPDE